MEYYKPKRALKKETFFLNEELGNINDRGNTYETSTSSTNQPHQRRIPVIADPVPSTSSPETPENNSTVAERSSRSVISQCGNLEQYVSGLTDVEPGQVKVYRVGNSELDPLDRDKNFYFFSGDCYVVKYSYPYRKRRSHLLYVWQGRDSPLKLRRTASLLARTLDHRLHGYTTQIRVLQGHEPTHLRRLLRGNMVVYLGNRGYYFKGPETFDNRVRLFKVRSSCLGDGQAIEVPALASSLNSEEAYILETPASSYLWYGHGCSVVERQVANNLCHILSPHKKIFIIEEGSEFPDFWSTLGGRVTYPHSYLHHRRITVPLRLYHCVLVDNSLRLDEINHFDQHELLDDDVSIIDSGDNVYVWVGSHATEEEKELAIERAEEILEKYSEGRSEEAVVFAVRRGYEPPTLVNLFPSWKEEYWPADNINPDEEGDDEIIEDGIDTGSLPDIEVHEDLEASKSSGVLTNNKNYQTSTYVSNRRKDIDENVNEFYFNISKNINNNDNYDTTDTDVIDIDTDDGFDFNYNTDQDNNYNDTNIETNNFVSLTTDKNFNNNEYFNLFKVNNSSNSTSEDTLISNEDFEF
ncbi:gelsolin-like [Lycorma delicatula]|uniref:gelsolin-like n=1 Tax=Lycorma delicatula TaxID=130591 RepID=UPI003F5160A3